MKKFNTVIVERCTDNSGKNFSFKNFTKSFFMAIFFTGVLAFFLWLIVSNINDTSFVKVMTKNMCFLIAFATARRAYAYKTGKYKKCTNPVILGVLTYLLLPIGVWVAEYQFLQIKDGNVQLKPEKNEEIDVDCKL